MKRLIGTLLVCWPIVLMLVGMVLDLGVVGTLVLIGTVLLVFASVFGGMTLIFGTGKQS